MISNGACPVANAVGAEQQSQEFRTCPSPSPRVMMMMMMTKMVDYSQPDSFDSSCSAATLLSHAPSR